MNRFLHLILKNLGRNKLRTALNALAVALLVTVCVEMLAVTLAARARVAVDASQSKLVVSERWVMPSRVPRRFVPELTRLAGVEDWTIWCFYGGYFDESGQETRAGLGIATRHDNLLEMHANLAGLDPAAVEALRQDRTGALVGLEIMQRMQWQVGQSFTFHSVSHPGKDLRFRIVGVLPAGGWAKNFLFRHDYFAEGTGDKETVGCVWLRTPSAEAARQVAAEVQRAFGDREPELKVETESAGVARFVGQGQAVLSLIDLVVLVLLLDMVIVLSNSISVATRERRVERAVLKVLGFRPLLIFGLVSGEAVLIGAVSGLLGAALAFTFSALALNGTLAPSPLTETFLMFPVRAWSIPLGVLLGAAVAFLGSALPAWAARRVKVSDVFARIA
jgi:putative ABC transport system permease protein